MEYNKAETGLCPALTGGQKNRGFRKSEFNRSNHKTNWFKTAVAAVFIIITLLVQNVPGTGLSSGDNSIELLFPENMRASVLFIGEFSAEQVARLKKLLPYEAMNVLNILRGDHTGDLMLDRPANRMESAVMLVRLLGAEQEALSENYTHPFTDVASWAEPYVGYLYKYDLTKGIGKNLFGSEQLIDEKSYLTFLLRVLGYSDKNGEDFTWDTVEQAAKSAGLLNPGESLGQGTSLLRMRLSTLSWRAMLNNHIDYNKPLIALLYESGVIQEKGIKALLVKNAPLIDQWLSFLPDFERGFNDHKESIELPLNKALAESNMNEYLNSVIERANISTGVFTYGYSTELWRQGDNYTLYFSPHYDNTLEEGRILSDWADQIIDIIITDDMSVYEKEKAIHDFIVNTLQYDTSTEDIEKIPESSRSAFGALKTGKGVCEAYAELMTLLLNRVGIPCRMITGTSEGVPHVWNIVLINGNTYHVDATWDDPVSDSGESTLCYHYFNLTDEEMKRDHDWNTENYPICDSDAENYYIKNNMVAESPEHLNALLRQTVEKRDKSCTFKLRGFDAGSLDVGQIMNDINEEAGYVLSGYSYSLNEAIQIISFHNIEYAE